MKKLFLAFLCLSPGLALTQTPPPSPATVADVLAGTATYKFISPAAAAGAGLSSPTNGVTAATVTNIVNGLAPALSVSNALYATNLMGTLVPKTRYVSQSIGNNSTAIAGNPSLAWANISNAVAASTYGDIVHVFPGNYTGQVNMVDGVVLNYEAGVTHRHPLAQSLFSIPSTATNIKVLGAGDFPGYGPIGPGILFTGTNVNLKIVFQYNTAGDMTATSTGQRQQRMMQGSFKRFDAYGNFANFVLLNAYNTNSSAVMTFNGGTVVPEYQSGDVIISTNKFYNCLIDLGSYDHEGFGYMEVYGGQVLERGGIVDQVGGVDTYLGTSWLGDGTSAMLLRESYDGVVGGSNTGTNIFGYYYRSNMLTAERAFKINSQNEVAKLYMTARSGNITRSNSYTYFDGTNGLVGLSGARFVIGSLATNTGSPGQVVTAQADGSVTWSNPPASGSGGWTGNANQFSVAGGTTNIKSGALTTNLSAQSLTNRMVPGTSSQSVMTWVSQNSLDDLEVATVKFDANSTKFVFDRGINADGSSLTSLTIGNISGWPANSSGYLNNNGSGTLSWGTPSGSLPADPSVASVLTNKNGGPTGWFPIASLAGGSSGTNLWLQKDASTWTNALNAAMTWSSASPTSQQLLLGANDYINNGAQRWRASAGLEVGSGTYAWQGTGSSGGLSEGDGSARVWHSVSNYVSGGVTVGGALTLGTSPSKITLDGSTGSGGFDSNIVSTNGRFIGNGINITNINLTSLRSVTNTFGSQSVDFSLGEVSTNASAAITFAQALISLNPTNHNHFVLHVLANGADRTVTKGAGWRSTRTTHVVTNGTVADFHIEAVHGQFTNMSQVDFVP